MEPFFTILKQLCSEKNIHIKDIWNMDETSIVTSLRVNGLIIGVSKKRRIYVKGVKDRE